MNSCCRSDLPATLFTVLAKDGRVMMQTNPFAADGIVYAKKTLYALELYTAEKDPDVEAALEKALTAAGIFYSKSDETYIDEEQMFYVIYEIEV